MPSNLVKYRIYIDEVGNSDLKSSQDPNHRFLCLAGIIMELEHVRGVFQPQLEQLKRTYFNAHPDEPVIFHRKELMQKKPPFQALANPEMEQKFNLELLSLLKSWQFTVIGVVIDIQEHNTNYSEKWKHDPYHYCLGVLLERFRMFLNFHNAIGDMMIESRGGKEDMRLKQSFRDLMENGTTFLTAEELQTHITSKELKVKPKEANIAGLQLADLLAHSVRRYCFHVLWNYHDGKVTFSDAVIELLVKEKFFVQDGKIIEYGINKLP